MIVEGNNPDYCDIIESAEMKTRIFCGHDFWEQAKLLDYGDVILCQRCGQYFTKIKHLMWVIREKEVLNPTPQVKKMFVKPKQNHQNRDVWVRVPVRITDGE